MLRSVILFGILYEDTYTNFQLELILLLLFSISFPLLIYYIMDRMIDNQPSKVDILVSALLTAFMIFLVNFFSYMQETVAYLTVAYLIILIFLLSASGHLLIYLADRTADKPEQSKKDILTLILLSALLMSTIFSLLIPVLWNTPP